MADRTQVGGGDSPYKLYKIRVSGEDRATVRGYLTVEEVKALEECCKAAGVECTIEEENFPVLCACPGRPGTRFSVFPSIGCRK